MNFLENFLLYKNYQYVRLDGQVSQEKREQAMYQFNAPDSPHFVFLLSTRAGGLGLNLATADTVIIFDSDWNPSMDSQAQDRAHRIGQRNDVRVFRFISNSPVEEKISSRATEKLTMNELVVEAGKFDSSEADLDKSLERQQLMKELLSDFTTDGPSSNQDGGSSQDDTESQTTSDVGETGEDNDEVENLNEMLSSNEEDYELYQSIDSKWAATPGLKKGIFTDETTIPDWIKFPKGRKVNKAMAPPAEGGREKKKVIYDDGLTEKQFLRMVDKMEAGGELPTTGAVSTTLAPQIASVPLERPAAPATGMNYFPPIGPAPSRSRKSHEIPPGALPNDINNKLINTTKAIIYYKEAQTKRRLAEVFLERPSPQMYPDYYQIIKEPIGMNDILRKCRARLFTEVKQWFDDWRQLFKNARTYNPEGSWVVNDANTLEKEDRITGKNGLAAMLPQPAPKPLRIKLSLKRLQKGASSDTSGPKSKKVKVTNSPKAAPAASTTGETKSAADDPSKKSSNNTAADSSLYS